MSRHVQHLQSKPKQSPHLSKVACMRMRDGVKSESKSTIMCEPRPCAGVLVTPSHLTAHLARLPQAEVGPVFPERFQPTVAPFQEPPEVRVPPGVAFKVGGNNICCEAARRLDTQRVCSLRFGRRLRFFFSAPQASPFP